MFGAHTHGVGGGHDSLLYTFAFDGMGVWYNVPAQDAKQTNGAFDQ